MFVEMWGFRRLLLNSNARIISNAPYAGGAGFQRLLLSSNARIISNAPYACGAVLSWAESTQRPPLS